MRKMSVSTHPFPHFHFEIVLDGIQEAIGLYDDSVIVC